MTEGEAPVESDLAQTDTYASALRSSPAATVVDSDWSPPMVTTGALVLVTVSCTEPVPHAPRKLHMRTLICVTPGLK